MAAALSVPGIVIDTTGCITYANTSACETVASELTGLRLGKFLRDENGEDPWSSFGDRVWRCPHPMQLHCPQRGERAVQVYVTPIGKDSTRGLLVFFDDEGWAHDPADLLTRVRQQEDRIALATREAGIGVFDRVLAPDDPTPPYWSESMRTMLGYPMDADADPEWFFERVHMEDRPAMLAAIAKSEDRKTPSVEVTVRWQHPDGRERRILIRARTLLHSQAGQQKSARSIGVVMDMTERYLTEAQLQLRSEILDQTPDLVAINAADGELLYLNSAGRQLLGIDAATPLAGVDLRRAYSEESLVHLMNDMIPSAIRLGASKADVEFVGGNGSPVPLSQVLIAHRRGSGRVTHFSTIARDLTRERQLEAQFLQAQKMEAIGRLAGGVAHDFNNLLSVILGATELALSELEVDHRVRSDLQSVLDASQRAAALTGQLLAFGRKQFLQPKVLDVALLIRDMSPILERLLDDNIEVRMREVVDAQRIRVDRSQFQQVLLNLVVNARDAMPDGGVVMIETGRERIDDEELAENLSLSPGAYVVLTVADTGQGMDDQTRERIFEPFFTTKAVGSGTGLGLSTVFGIVRQSGGSVWVYSRPGLGTTFKLYFPATDEPEERVTTAPSDLPSGVGAGSILVVDDEPPLRNIVEKLLRRGGYDVLTAGPEQAVELAREHADNLSLLLTDVLMPGVSGKQVAEQVCAIRPDIAVLYMSGYTETNIVHHGVLDPSVDFVAKPITGQRLLSAVAKTLNHQRPPRTRA